MPIIRVLLRTIIYVTTTISRRIGIKTLFDLGVLKHLNRKPYANYESRS